ncbi:MAG: exosortase [Planctomycetota bacterium]
MQEEPAAGPDVKELGGGGGWAWGIAVPAVACIAAFGALYAPVFARLAKWWWNDGNYSHGFLVPVISGVFVYSRRKELSRLMLRPSALGWAATAAGIMGYFVGVAAGVFYVQALSVLVVLGGAALALGGWRALGFFAFAILYLALMIPLPGGIYQALTFKLQLLATRASAAVLDLAGAPVYADANVIRFAGGKSLAIAEACSGLRSILGLTATSLAFVYFLREEPIWERAVLVASTLGIAILANVFRIAGTGLLYQYVSPQAAEGFFHGLSGWLVFVLALFVLLVEYRVLRALFIVEEEPGEGGEGA